MTSLLIKLWAIDALSSFGLALTILSIIGAVASIVCFLISLDENFDEEMAITFKKRAKFFALSFISLLFSFLFPSKETAQILRIGICAESAVNLAQSSETFGKVSDNISDSLIRASNLLKTQCENWAKDCEEKTKNDE